MAAASGQNPKSLNGDEAFRELERAMTRVDGRPEAAPGAWKTDPSSISLQKSEILLPLPGGRNNSMPCAMAGGEEKVRREYFIWNRCNPLKSPESDE
jgi:hypothetical protein